MSGSIEASGREMSQGLQIKTSNSNSSQKIKFLIFKIIFLFFELRFLFVDATSYCQRGSYVLCFILFCFYLEKRGQNKESAKVRVANWGERFFC